MDQTDIFAILNRHMFDEEKPWLELISKNV